jgi:hypothetical protein
MHPVAILLYEIPNKSTWVWRLIVTLGHQINYCHYCSDLTQSTQFRNLYITLGACYSMFLLFFFSPVGISLCVWMGMHARLTFLFNRKTGAEDWRGMDCGRLDAEIAFCLFSLYHFFFYLESLGRWLQPAPNVTVGWTIGWSTLMFLVLQC